MFQINNIDVNTREQAVTLFSEKALDITLLVARPQLQVIRQFSFYFRLEKSS